MVTAVMLASATAGCSRLSFIRPSSKTIAVPQTESEYHVSDSAATKQRLATQDRLRLATQRLGSGDLVAAERETKLLLKDNPGSADAYTLLAVIRDQQGNTAQAGENYKRAAELAPSQGGVLNNYGAWLCTNGFPAEALVWFDRALAAPGYATPGSALANAGGCALKAGQYERAGRDLRQALSLEPGNAYALASMADNEYRQGRYFEARAFTERRLAAAPADPAVLQLAADIEGKLGDKAAASRYVQRLRAEFPSVTANPGETARP
ncbi:MAG: type IV pilus biogenesis/stability protein PilW [Pseudoxanthomonas sp.]